MILALSRLQLASVFCVICSLSLMGWPKAYAWKLLSEISRTAPAITLHLCKNHKL